MNILTQGLEEVQEGIVLHGCNAQGVMGSGVAKALRDAHPKIFEDYRRVFESEGLALGSVVWTSVHDRLWIASGITQQYYGRVPGHQYVSYEALQQVVKQVKQKAQALGLPVFVNRIGCGLGGGDWGRVEPLLKDEWQGISWSLCDPPMPMRPSPKSKKY